MICNKPLEIWCFGIELKLSKCLKSLLNIIVINKNYRQLERNQHDEVIIGETSIYFLCYGKTKDTFGGTLKWKNGNVKFRNHN